jgi:hypothetical protein
MSILQNEQLSPREHLLLENEKEQNRLSREHALELKHLEIELQRSRLVLENEIRKTEMKWQQVFKLPMAIIKLPVMLLFGVAVVASYITKHEIKSRSFWQFMLDRKYID